jgi:myosin-5
MNNESKTNKTYVWVRLRGDNGGNTLLTATTTSSNAQARRRIGNTVADKKRGAPTSASGAGSEEEDVWGWTPGFYCSKEDGDDDGNSQEPSSSGGDIDPLVHFTLLPLHHHSADNNSSSDDNNDFHQTEYTLTESQTTALLSSGDIVLANQWEQHDFVNRLQLGNDTSDHEDESDYNYDESDSDSDDSTNNNKHRQISHLFDAQEDTPPPNLIDLTHLHECSVVHALRYRYQNTHLNMSNIYTDTGPILLAVNPFKHDESGDLYGEGTARRYRVDGERRWLSERTPGGGSSAVSSLPSSSKNSSAQHETGLGEGSSSSSSSSLSPHVFAVADRTFRTMMTRLHPPDADTLSTPNATSTPAPAKSISSVTQQDKPKVDQSVLVSGESGAGKTVTTKLLMGYLAKLSEQPSPEGGAASEESSDDSNIMSIERRVLESNPIMESFGNARTVRNDNSSRFGKYIEMKFSSSLKQQQQQHSDNKVAGATLVGASIETYLLEKVRLVHQSQGERNYHIFYELFSMKYNDEEDDDQANQALLERFGLVHYDMEDFSLINTSDTYDRRDGVSDADTFRDMKRAMTIMGIPTTEQHSVFAVCCALLHASNLNFVDIGEVECALETENPHLEYVVDLLGITRDGLNKAICYYEITIGGCGGKSGETHRRELSQAQAKKGVEALIKATYGAMFQYLVDRINKSIAGDAKSNGGGSSSRPNNRRKGELHGTIGILDIFGFESFQVNSFEQLCINYCNEALQQQFNRFVLRNEQEEYDKEGIPWSFIEFPENQDVLDLIDQKGSGILNVLHDQCRTPGASDKSFALLMYDKCASHSRFEADSRQVAEQLFAVHHYAGLVEYDIEGFVEKNKDELPKEASDLLLSSNNEFVMTLAENLQPSPSAGRNKIMSPRSGASQRPTVGVQFSSQLHSLRSKIDETSPHYIRCLKPNNLLAPDIFDAALIADQLRCAGVIEAVRVSRLGYPQRYSHNQFISRYRILGMKALKKKKNSPKKFNPAKALVHAVKAILKVDDNQDDIGIQVGKSKVFLKREAYDTLERLRRDKITSSVFVIQKNARCYVYRKYYSQACKAVHSIQCFLRCSSAKKEVNRLRRQHRSIIIQSYWRRCLSRKLLLSAKIIAKWCQSHLRGSLGRKMYNAMNHDRKAIYLQSIWRRYVAVSSFKRHRCAAVNIQCAIRSHKSRAKLSQLKSDARDLHAVLIERDMLRQEIIELKKITQDRKVDQVSAVVVDDANSSIAEKDTEIASLRSALDYMSSEKERVERELNEALQTLASVKEQKDNYAEVSKALQIEMNALDETHRSEMKRLSTDLSAMKSENQQIRERKDDAHLLVVGAVGADSQSQAVGKLDDTTSNNLRQEIARLTDINSKLQQENYDLSEKHASHIKAVSDFSRRETVLAANTSVCTSFTADITDTEEDMSKLREENQILRKQLELLRRMGPNDVIPDDQEYDESVVPDEEGSAASSEKGFIDDTHVVYAASSDKSDQDERIRLQQLINELREELKQTKQRAKYDLDDVNRVNASLRRDLERAEYTSTALNDELDLRYEEYETLQEDMEKFAETFATQHEELQQLERRFKKLTSENEELQSSSKDKSDKIINLEAQVATLKTAQSRAPEWVGDEIGKLWSEISRLKRDEMESASHTSK